MALSSLANLAISVVATAPSPATSGTSLVVTTGQGSRFPASGSFPIVIWPTATTPTPANAEIALCTVVSTDTLTITRAQEGTSARTVVIGDQVMMAVTKAVLDGMAVNVQTFTSAGTWTKPVGGKWTEITLFGAGGGGGSGRRGATGTNRGGGGGGGGGGFTRVGLPTANLPSSCSVAVGAGGPGGAASSVNDTNGANGTAGGSTYVTLGSNASGTWITGEVIHASGGGGGGGGTTAGGTNGQAGVQGSQFNGTNAGAGTTGNGSGTSGLSEGSRGSSAGGGGGGLSTAADSSHTGGYSTVATWIVSDGTQPWVEDTVGGNGVNGLDASGWWTWAGVAGPGGSGGCPGFSGTAGGRGGDASSGGGGGGGGGASANGANSGRGGNGGDGIAYITTYF